MTLQEISNTLLSIASYADVLPKGHESQAPAHLILTQDEHDALQAASDWFQDLIEKLKEYQ